MDPQEKVVPSWGEFCSLVPSMHVTSNKEWCDELRTIPKVCMVRIMQGSGQRLQLYTYGHCWFTLLQVLEYVITVECIC